MPENVLDGLWQADARRHFHRVQVDLPGRYMLADRRGYPCHVHNMSPGGMVLAAPVVGRVGERVVVYISHLGRLEGKIVRVHSLGFAMTIVATRRKRDKLANQLTWLANRHFLDLPEQRRHERIVPCNTRTAMLLPDGFLIACRIIEMSASGAAVASETKPPLHAVIRLGKIEGRVVRISDEDCAVAFTYLQDPDSLEQNAIIPVDATPSAQPLQRHHGLFGRRA